METNLTVTSTNTVKQGEVETEHFIFKDLNIVQKENGTVAQANGLIHNKVSGEYLGSFNYCNPGSADLNVLSSQSHLLATTEMYDMIEQLQTSGEQ
jgi:hypothetical protein